MSDKGQITGVMSPLLEKWRMDKILQHVTGENILDYGCGYGKFASIIDSKRYVGVEINKNVLEIARETYCDNSAVFFCTPEEFKHMELKYDNIILSAVIEHLEKPTEILVQLKQRLSDSGSIIITTPTHKANKILEFGAHLHLFSKEAIDEHDQLFDKKDFIQISKITGLVLEKYECFELGLNQLVVYRNASKTT